MALSTYTYEQLGFGTELGPLTDKEKEAMEKSWAAAFASDIFPYIDEQIFIPLYSEKKSRRNVPVNVLAGAMLLQEIRGMSDEDLVEAAMFDLRLRTALHITNAVGQPLSLRTIQRFRTRIKRYRESGGEDLLRICFDQIGGRLEPFMQKYAKYMVSASRTAEENRNRRKAGNRTGLEEMAAPAVSDGKGAKNDVAPAVSESAVPESAGTERGNALEHRSAAKHRNSGAVSVSSFDASGNEGAATEKGFDPSIPANPEIFKENCLEAHSDHRFFADEEEMEEAAFRPYGTEGSALLRFSLNGPWKYSLAARPADAPEGFEALSYDCGSWAEIRLPEQGRPEEHRVSAYQNWQYPWDGREDIAPGGIPERFNPTASYVKYFCVPSAMRAYLKEGSPLLISFRDAESGFALWCNGHYVGYSEGGFGISEFDLTPFAQEGENKLAARVFKWTASGWLDCRNAYRPVGIAGDVFLYTVPAAHIFDLQIRPTLNETLTAGALEIEAKIRLSGACRDAASEQRNDAVSVGTRPDRLRLYYTLMKGEEHVLSGAAGVDADAFDAETSTVKISISERIESPILWSAEDPQLYELTLRLTGGKIKGETKLPEETEKDGFFEPEYAESPDRAGKKEQAGDFEQNGQAEQVLFEIVREKLGFRRFETKDGRMYLNGKRIVFRGVNPDESGADKSGAVTAEFQNLQAMKRHNINAVCTYHYPGLSDFCRICDELGLYLIVENRRVIRAGQAQAESGLSAPWIVPYPDARWSALLQDRVNSCCRRFGNHPSILIRSAGDAAGEGSVLCDAADYLRNPDSGYPIDCEWTFQGYNRRMDDGRLQDIKYKYQSIRFEVKKDSVCVMNDNLFIGTDRYECRVRLDRVGHKAAEALLNTSVEPLSKAEYALPRKILDRIEAISSKAEKEKSAVEYAVTVSMCLREDCAWARKGYEISFGQKVFIAGESAGSKDTGDTADAARAETAAGSVCRESAGSKDSAEAAPAETGTVHSDIKGDAAGDGTVSEIIGSDSNRTITLRTSAGKLELTRGSFNVGVRGDHFEVLFSVKQGGIVSFRRGGNLFTGCGMTGPAPGQTAGGTSFFKAGELFEKIPRPCFWRAPLDNSAGNHMAARSAVWKYAEEYLIPCPETLRIFAENESVLLRMKYALPIPGVIMEQRESETSGEQGTLRNPTQNHFLELLPEVIAGYRIFADGRLTMTLDWEPVADGTNADERGIGENAAPAFPPIPIFGFNFSLSRELDRLVYYGNGPARNYFGFSCGARLGIYSGTVGDIIPSDSGNRGGVRWAELTDCGGRGIRFSAGDTDREMDGAGDLSGAVIAPRAMELSVLSLAAPIEGSLFSPYKSERSPEDLIEVCCALTQADTGCYEVRSARTMPYYGIPTERKLHFAVTVEII